MFEILGKTSINFMRWRRYSFTVSTILTILGSSRSSKSLVVSKYGIDFSGGTADPIVEI